MKWSLILALVLMLGGVATVTVAAQDAAPVPTLDAGPARADAGPAPVAGLPPVTLEDPGAFVEAIVDSAKAGNWRALAALGLVLVIWAVRRYGTRWWDWLGTDKGGAALVLVIGILSQLAVVIFGKDPLGWKTIVNGIVLGFTAAGGWTVMKKLLPSAEPDPVPTPPDPPKDPS